MQPNKVHSISTIERVADELDETVDWLHGLAINMDPEDGVISVCGRDKHEVIVFRPFGIENLREMIAMENEALT